MSVADELRALEKRVEKRLRELAPKVAEYRDLEKVAERLGIKRDPLPEPTDVETTKPAAKRKPKPSRSAARKARATASRASKRAASTTALTSAADGASTDAASAPQRSRAASRKRAAKAKSKPASKRARAGAKRSAGSGRSAAAPGQRQQDVLRLVSERPGITVAQLAEELNVDATGLYGVVRRLQTKGQLSKDGTALHPIASTESTDAGGASAPDSPLPPSEPPAADS